MQPLASPFHYSLILLTLFPFSLHPSSPSPSHIPYSTTPQVFGSSATEDHITKRLSLENHVHMTVVKVDGKGCGYAIGYEKKSKYYIWMVGIYLLLPLFISFSLKSRGPGRAQREGDSHKSDKRSRGVWKEAWLPSGQCEVIAKMEGDAEAAHQTGLHSVWVQGKRMGRQQCCLV